MNRTPFVTAALACSATLLAVTLFSHAGPLDPPAGPITPTYKTLAEVEPRTAINATNTPGDASTIFTISKPGSYYLTQNIQLVANKTGIATTVSDVTIDLNGFTITGIANSGFGVANFGGSSRTTVRNGRFQAMHFGGILLGADAVVEDMVINILDANSDGVTVGDRSVVRRCQIQGGTAAVNCSAACTVENITATGVAIGIFANNKADLTVRNCRLLGTTTNGTGVQGGDRLSVRGVQTDKFGIAVQAATNATVQDCFCTNTLIGVLAGNTARVSDTTIAGATSTAMQVGDNSQVTRCTVTGALGNGIDVENDCIVTSCTVTGCSTTGIIGASRNTLVDCSSSKNLSSSGGFFFTDSNNFTNCRADENTADGFNARFGNVWQSCSARGNVGDGIESSVGGTIRQCRMDSSGAGAPVGANIRLTGDACRVEDNMLIGADFGIQTTGGGSTIHHNTSHGSANNYGGIAGGNDVGPIGTSAAATSPWANIQY